MRVAFRVDASTEIGMGHLQRCLSLANAMRDAGAEVLFVCRDLGVDCATLAANSSISTLVLPRPSQPQISEEGDPAHAVWARVSWRLDVNEAVRALSDFSPDWVVVDHYGFDERWHRTAKSILDCRIAVIDDLGDRALNADLVLDHNPSADHGAKYGHCAAGIGRILGGPRFALISARYASIEAVRYAHDVQTIGVFMGGVDAANLSPIVLRACRKAGFSGQIEIVSTSTNPHLAALQEAVVKDQAAKLSIDLPDLVDFFVRHDLQIGAGGGATWERCRAGAPSVVLATALNQQLVISELTAAKAALGLMVPDEASIVSAVKNLIESPKLRIELGQRAAALVDGRGCDRAALAIMGGSLTIRLAGCGDVDLVYRWRNDPLTRAMSLDSGALDYELHCTWFARSLAMPDHRRIYIGHVGALPVGVVRFDRIEGSTDPELWRVSIFLDPQLLSLGLGPGLLQASETALWHERAGNLRLIATAKEENAASRALFRGAGYDGVTEFVKQVDMGSIPPGKLEERAL